LRPYPRQRQMRTERSTFGLDPQLATRHLDVVVQQLEPRLLLHAQPYDASPSKVREGAESAEAHEQLTMARGNARQRGLDFVQSFGRLLAEKLEGQVQQRFAHPGELRRTLAQWDGRKRDLTFRLGWQINREKQPH